MTIYFHLFFVVVVVSQVLSISQQAAISTYRWEVLNTLCLGQR